VYADSERLAKVRSKDTAAEVFVRQLIYSLGRRYRLHLRSLPGQPDIVFPGRHKVIFVNGCFWHRHKGCPKAQEPATRQDYWNNKFARTVERDENNYRALISAGWQIMIIWECELSQRDILIDRINRFLG
jgi:DNA mismatch endonuclease (patch repair protein)